MLDFTSFRKASKAATIAGVALFSAGYGTSAIAADFTEAQCRDIAAVAGTVVRTVGKENLSVEFRQSFRDFLGAKLTCDGPKNLSTPTDKDLAALLTIEDISPSHRRRSTFAKPVSAFLGRWLHASNSAATLASRRVPAANQIYVASFGAVLS